MSTLPALIIPNIQEWDDLPPLPVIDPCILRALREHYWVAVWYWRMSVLRCDFRVNRTELSMKRQKALTAQDTSIVLRRMKPYHYGHGLEVLYSTVQHEPLVSCTVCDGIGAKQHRAHGWRIEAPCDCLFPWARKDPVV